MLTIDFFDTNTLRKKELSKILLNDDFVVKSFTNLEQFFSNSENIKLITINDINTFNNSRKHIKTYSAKKSLIVIINEKHKEIINELKTLGTINFIFLPLHNIREVSKLTASVIEKVGLRSERKNMFLSILENTKKILSTNGTFDPHEVDKLKKQINSLEKLLKQYQTSRHSFAGSLSEIPVFELLKFIWQFFNKGVLYIESENLKGEIVVKGENIVSCVCNNQSIGLKAFDFMSTLTNGTFNFNEHITKNYTTNKDLLKYSFNTLIEHSFNTYKWFKVNNNNIPNSNLKLKLIHNLLTNNNFNSNEFEIMTEVIQNTRVKNIVLSNKLNLIDSYETLINLRKRGILEVFK